MTRLSLLFAVLMGGCVGPSVALPPLEFDHTPAREYQDIRMSYWDVDSACRSFGYLPRGRLSGCVVPGRVPLRIVPNDVDSVTLAALIRHENGHLNGWDKNHLGAE